jgi:Mycothiol maleylpyruvate isomerase N-terminal domain
METELARSAMAAAYCAMTEDVGRLGEDDLAGWSRCGGWMRADVLLHTLLDAQRALVTFASPTAGEPDVDFVSYWQPFRPGSEGSAEHARFVRRVTAAYSSSLVIARQWAETAAAAVHAAGQLPADLKVATQGHVLALGDFLATLAVEASIHHLDLRAGPGELGGPSAEGMAAVHQTLDGILGAPAPTDWGDVTYALKGAGRAGLTPADRARLGSLAARFPLLG